MESRRPALQKIHLPSIDSRMTPPPEEMSPVSSENPSSLASNLPEGVSESTQSGVSTPSTPSKRRHRQRRSSSGSRPRLETLKPLPLNINPGIPARSYEDANNERAYLNSSLQWYAARVADLTRRFSSIQSLLERETGKERRRLKKQLSLLKAKIHETTEQEKAIFVRLGELYVEFQTRETLTPANDAAPFRSYSWDGYTGTPSVYDAMSPLSCGMPTPTTPLNALSPSFVPLGYLGDAWHTAEPGVYYPGAVEPLSGLETVDEAEEMLYSPGVTSNYENMEEYEDTTYRRRLSCDIGMLPIRERRLSLPCPQNAWPEA